MQPLNDVHLECLRQALSILAKGLAENSERLSALKLEQSAGDKSISEPNAAQVQTITKIESEADVEPLQTKEVAATFVFDETLKTGSAAGLLSQPSFDFFKQLSWHKTDFPVSDAIKPSTTSVVIPNITNEAATSVDVSDPRLLTTSNSFFTKLPWLVDSASAGAIFSIQESKNKSLSNVSKTEDFFRNLPWETSFKSEEALSNAITVAQTIPAQTSKAFFGGLRWQVTDIGEIPKAVVSVTQSKPTNELGLSKISGKTFFQGLNWNGQSNSDIKIQPIQRDSLPLDAKTMGELATQSALKAAARATKPKTNPLGLKSGDFFKTTFSPNRLDQERLNPINHLSIQTISKNKEFFQNLPWH